jgi:hypothetical protein
MKRRERCLAARRRGLSRRGRSRYPAADRLSRSVAQPQRSDRRAWATMLWGDQIRKVIQEMSVRHRSRGDLINRKEPPCASSIHLSPRC